MEEIEWRNLGRTDRQEEADFEIIDGDDGGGGDGIDSYELSLRETHYCI